MGGSHLVRDRTINSAASISKSLAKEGSNWTISESEGGQLRCRGWRVVILR